MIKKKEKNGREAARLRLKPSPQTLIRDAFHIFPAQGLNLTGVCEPGRWAPCEFRARARSVWSRAVLTDSARHGPVTSRGFPCEVLIARVVSS